MSPVMWRCACLAVLALTLHSAGAAELGRRGLQQATLTASSSSGSAGSTATTTSNSALTFAAARTATVQGISTTANLARNGQKKDTLYTTEQNGQSLSGFVRKSTDLGVGGQQVTNGAGVYLSSNADAGKIQLTGNFVDLAKGLPAFKGLETNIGNNNCGEFNIGDNNGCGNAPGTPFNGNLNQGDLNGNLNNGGFNGNVNIGTRNGNLNGGFFNGNGNIGDDNGNNNGNP